MKKLLYATLFTACSSLGLMSCMNGDYDANPDTNNSSVGNPLNTGGSGGTGGGGGGSNAIMTAKINGTQWTASTGIVSTQLGLMLLGTNSSQSMQLAIISYNGPATYALSGGTAVAQYVNGTTQTVSTSGEVIVAHETATQVDGTFHWEGNGTSVTEGTFNIKK